MGDTQRIVYWVQRLSEIAMVGWLSMLLLVDVVASASVRGAQFLVPLCGVAGIVAIMLRRRHLVMGFCVTVGLSLVTSLVIGVTNTPGLPGMAESGAILLLTISLLRHVTPMRRAVLVSLVGLVALMAEGVGRDYLGSAGLAFSFVLFVGWSIAEGLGLYLRIQQDRRRDTLSSVRRAERLELARELHDLVAHHITGIVVQAQAAKTVAEMKPEAVGPALDAIANAGTEALTSMRRLVGVLRADDEAARRPGTTLADLRLLTESFTASGPQVAFEVGAGLDERALAPEVLTTMHRVLQEALTNVRRHAPGTGWVEVDLRPVGGPYSPAALLGSGLGVRLRVRNYSSAADPRIKRLGGGFGLVGMAERVEALGGRLWAGPTEEGAWEVVAEVPT
ncbi:sensor histidine kinase [Nonomuraea soli]|uniref:histidine kinase n=1 Tax=Nonomuraea soli TaxID=1032476 RepID=A0A7W0CR12_9ACTN|nr:histidine kinase [Nonomuraea soli]MBA2895608.1 signal transduction histidine kinase [Nonomuraea soli]